MTKHRTFLAAVAATALALHAGNTWGETAARTSQRSSPVVAVVKKVKDAVVNIHSERSVRAGSDDLFSTSPAQSRVNGMGTGIIIDPRGYIITNQHVVDDVSTLRVRLSDGTTANARILARDTENDLALIKITPPKPLTVMPLGTARDLEVGEGVVAVGNAYGYDHTVSKGVVSALGRDVTLNREVRYRSLIQTDAAINPGNSGGPLVNMDGELVGVNVAIRAGAQGIGFAIPVDTMIQVASRMMAQERARAGVADTGLKVRDEVADTAASRKVVLERADGPAARAGLQRGDEVVKVGGHPVRCSLDLHRAVLGVDAGRKVQVVVRRGAEEKQAEVTLEALAATDERPAPPAMAGSLSWRKIGLKLEPLAGAAEVTRSHPKLKGGVYIAEVRENGPASRAGIRRGDVLIGLGLGASERHQWEMLQPENVHYVLTHPDWAASSPLQFYILRGGQIHRGWITAE
jgi:serine protease Do